MTRRVLLSAGTLTAAGALVFVLGVPRGAAQGTPQQAGLADTVFEAPEISDTSALEGPRQPIFFRHDVHAGQYGIDCQYCHVNIEISPKPGIPTLSSCMNCHLIVGSGIAEVDSVRAYFN